MKLKLFRQPVRWALSQILGKPKGEAVLAFLEGPVASILNVATHNQAQQLLDKVTAQVQAEAAKIGVTL